jgi:hypothetical protein
MKTQPDTIINSDTPVRLTWSVIVSIGFAIAAAATAFAVLKADDQATKATLSEHDARIRAIERKVEADHDLLLEIRGDVKALRKTP